MPSTNYDNWGKVPPKKVGKPPKATSQGPLPLGKTRKPGEDPKGTKLTSSASPFGSAAGRGLTGGPPRKPTEPPPYSGPVPSPGVPTGILPGGPMNTSPVSGYYAAQSQGTGGGPVSGGDIGNTGATGGVVTTPGTGFAANFNPESYPMVLSSPELILQALMTQQGGDPLGRGAGMMALGTPYMDALSSIMPLAWGGKLPPGGDVSAINWLAKMGQQGQTPGGAGIDFRDVIRSLAGLQPDPTGKNPGSYEGLFSGDPMTQVNNAKQVIYGAAQAGMPAFFQNAIRNAMNQQALAFLQQQATSKPGDAPQSFQDFMPTFFG